MPASSSRTRSARHRNRQDADEAARRRVEELGRRLHATGAPTWFVPTVGHDRALAPVLVTGLSIAFVLVFGIPHPLLAIAAVLAIGAAALRDAEGGRSWLRRLVPAQPGWAVVAEVGQGTDTPTTAPTILLWAPVAATCPGLTGRPAFLRFWAGLHGLVALVGVAGMALLAAAQPELGRALVLGAAAALVLLALVTAPASMIRRKVLPASDPEAMLAAVAPRLRGSPPPGVRVLVGAGSLGAPWFDDLENVVADARLGLAPARTVVLCLQPGRKRLALASPDGVLAPRRPAPELVAAMESVGLEARAARTPALRARLLGCRAVGLDGGEAAAGEGPGCLEAALRSIAQLLAPQR